MPGTLEKNATVPAARCVSAPPEKANAASLRQTSAGPVFVRVPVNVSVAPRPEFCAEAVRDRVTAALTVRPPARRSMVTSFTELLADGKEDAVVDEINRAVRPGDGWRVSLEDAGGKSHRFDQRVRRQIPAVSFAVLAVDEHTLLRGIDRRRVDAPFPHRPGNTGKSRIRRGAGDGVDFLH